MDLLGRLPTRCGGSGKIVVPVEKLGGIVRRFSRPGTKFAEARPIFGLRHFAFQAFKVVEYLQKDHRKN